MTNDSKFKEQSVANKAFAIFSASFRSCIYTTIILAPGGVPVASVATPILNIPTATTSEQPRSVNSVTLASETTSVTTNQTRTTVNIVQSNQQMVKAVIRPSTSSTSDDRSEPFGMPILTRETKPEAKQAPLTSTNTNGGDSLSFRQILPKNLKSKPLPGGASMRPMQVIRIECTHGGYLIISIPDCWSHSSQ